MNKSPSSLITLRCNTYAKLDYKGAQGKVIDDPMIKLPRRMSAGSITIALVVFEFFFISQASLSIFSKDDWLDFMRALKKCCKDFHRAYPEFQHDK